MNISVPERKPQAPVQEAVEDNHIYSDGVGHAIVLVCFKVFPNIKLAAINPTVKQIQNLCRAAGSQVV